MNITINFPQNRQFIEDLILQRTSPFLRLGGGQALKKWFLNGDKAQLFDYLFQKKSIDRYLNEVLEEISNEVKILTDIIPLQCFNQVVSIGPGNGILELMLLNRIPAKKILLIDIEENKTHQHGFGAKGSGYASLEETRKFLLSNGISNTVVVTCNPQKELIPNFDFDLLISILSMGFHYPCDEYVQFIAKHGRPNCRVVFDKRRACVDNGFDQLSKAFNIKGYIAAEKSDRVFLANDCALSPHGF